MFKSIQACRAVAALLVVLYHLGDTLALSKYFGVTQFRTAFSFGDSGVQFFFVLSGFIITWVHARDIGKPTTLRTYLRKRFERIYPTYWMIFGMVFVLAYFTIPSSVAYSIATLMKSLTLFPQDPAVVGGSGAPVIPAAWSLQYEVVFYVWVGFFIVSRLAGLGVTLIMAINYGACAVTECGFYREFLSNNLMLLFVLGVLVAYLCGRQRFIARPILLAGLAGAAFLICGALEAWSNRSAWAIDRNIAYGCLSAIIVLCLVSWERTQAQPITFGLLALIGDASYCLYLIHYPLISLLCKAAIRLGLVGTTGAIVVFPVIVTTCVAVSIAFYAFVERPLHRFLRRRIAAVKRPMSEDLKEA